MSSPEEKLNTLMVNAVSAVFENMAFMEVVLSNESLNPENSPDIAWSNILVNDPIMGQFTLLMPKSLALKITETIYGLIDDELTDQMVSDTLGELLNSIVGRFLREALPGELTFDVGLPEARVQMEEGERESAGFPRIEQPSIEWNFSLDEEPVMLASSGETLVQWLHLLKASNHVEK